MDNPRCDVLVTRGQKHAVFPQKLAVGAQLSKLVGWDRPTAVGRGGDRVDQLLGRLFAQGATLGGEDAKDPGDATDLPSISNEAAELERALRDPCWRLSNLYSIRTRDGSIVKFRPRPQHSR